MNGFLNTGLGFWELLGLITTVILGLIAVKIVFTYDLNKRAERKDKQLLGQLRNACTHFMFEKGGDNTLGYRPSVVSPPGYSHYFCSRCGLVIHDIESLYRDIEWYANHPDAYVKKEKKFQKLAKKAKYA